MGKAKRRDRYLAQVLNLQFFKENPDCREEVLNVLDWAMKNLCREDRVLWALGIMKRYYLANWYPPAGEKLPKKDLRKRRFIFREFDMSRMMEDHQLLLANFMPNWNHYASLAEVHDSIALREMPFHAEVDGKQVPLSVIGVLDGLRRLEISLIANSSYLYCEEGEDFLFLQDGWKWARIQDGHSRQEALAMGHCGNEYGHSSDVMYSLREPVTVNGEERWKPHLTFIARMDRFFGETKGRANSKPSSTHHWRVVELLKKKRFMGNSGGGYLPENNFSLLDLSDDQIVAIAEANPSFEISDSRLQKGVVKHDFGDGWEIALCPLQYGPRRRKTLRLSSSASLVVFRRVLWIQGRKETLPGLSFYFDKGYLGMDRNTLPPSVVPGIVDKFATMLDLMEVRGVTHGSLLFTNCPWLPLLGNPTVTQVIEERPIFASATLPGPLYEYFGCGPHLAHALSYQHGLDLRRGSDGDWTLARFRSTRRFFESIRDYPALRLLDDLKNGFLSAEERGELKQGLLHRLRSFRFSTMEISLLLEDPTTLGSACCLVVTDAGLGRLIVEIDLPEVTDVDSLLLHLVRTYDYERELDLVAV